MSTSAMMTLSVLSVSVGIADRPRHPRTVVTVSPVRIRPRPVGSAAPLRQLRHRGGQLRASPPIALPKLLERASGSLADHFAATRPPNRQPGALAFGAGPFRCAADFAAAPGPRYAESRSACRQNARRCIRSAKGKSSQRAVDVGLRYSGSGFLPTLLTAGIATHLRRRQLPARRFLSAPAMLRSSISPSGRAFQLSPQSPPAPSRSGPCDTRPRCAPACTVVEYAAQKGPSTLPHPRWSASSLEHRRRGHALLSACVLNLL
jgi:hypothetical protein